MVSALEHLADGEWIDCGKLVGGASVLVDRVGGYAIDGLDGFFCWCVSSDGAGKWLAGSNEAGQNGEL